MSAESIFRTYLDRMHASEDEVETYYECSECEIIVVNKDGTRLLYNELYPRTINVLPRDPDKITEEIFRIQFSRRLLTIMDIRHVTQKELSEMTGISKITINKYITAKATPSFYNIDRIAKALKVSADRLRFY